MFGLNVADYKMENVKQFFIAILFRVLSVGISLLYEINSGKVGNVISNLAFTAS
jgi:hypothetical protein